MMRTIQVKIAMNELIFYSFIKTETEFFTKVF